MIIRSILAAGFLLVFSMTGLQAFDRSTGSANQADACSKARKTTADRCLVTVPETTVYGSMSDHGPSYNDEGNPVDRHGNVVAVPTGRAGTQQFREVFVTEPRR
jgi:hypothetical protein